MPTYTLAEVTFQSLSPVVDNPGFGLVYSNSASGTVPQDRTDLMAQLVTSLTTLFGGVVHPPTAWMHPVVSRVASSAQIRLYDITAHLNGSPHGSPIANTVFTPTAAQSSIGPPEGVCAVLTLQAAYGTDVEFAPGARPRSRDRGRIYFGPLDNTTTATEAVTNRTYLAAAFRTDITKWIKAINSYTTTTPTTYKLGVWSRKNAAVKDLVQCWVDDRQDYQRRRSDQSTTRTSVALP